MTAPLQLLIRGQSPLIINIPHAGTSLPPGYAERLSDAARPLPDTDWHLPFLFHFAVYSGATLMAATHSRYVVDLNRDPGGASHYPGVDLTGLVADTTFSYDDIYRPGCVPDASQIDDRRQRYWEPYHDTLAEQIAAVHGRHGHAVLLDAHSIRAEVPRLFTGRLPDLNLGSCNGRSCDPSLRQAAVVALDADPTYSLSIDGIVKGGYSAHNYGIPEMGLHALHLEIVQAGYLDEANPQDWNPARAEPLQAVLRRLVDALVSWRPMAA
ncbi:N-formylglutamate deformylase [Nevskia ramosa]|uniref:N-formylglutamate deformylase n=1 Tax=Nevskia ramosa TaxID=64002 RepID=UPI0003B6050B|nr:N-formylglutamate deformylase [Nevskia ramosa]